MDRSRSSWEGQVGELTTELERLRAVNVECSEAAAEESCLEVDEAAALALTDMRALTTQSQGHEARVGPAPAIVVKSISKKKRREDERLEVVIKADGGKTKGAAALKRDWEAYWSKERELLKSTYEDRHSVIKHPGRPIHCRGSGCAKKTTSFCGGCQLAFCTNGGNCWARHHEWGYLNFIRGAEEDAKDAFERKKQKL
ncbi:hypothetical protein KFL_005250080 [Klebsormidium nitens]|uniref:Uncharacterized protein n=1 Tax=Klebsormidium nitens TaxID=105231 RepID=A0A1Y1IJ43_KLENI|nr:hypothetical protein KFL_005250080 [Klebsormidium nitens]|eukprot:GAQ89459.1 hypothetical protein KFL_005250080 [Klebsormidium nitens]